ncbi:putative ABC transporter substrate-binding lipoprotein YvrC [Lysinibacillus sp. PLM2]|nr:putative ABC transporter substrate-binding lipoprotein YvrC [Lysinibacillus sp. PLM2]
MKFFHKYWILSILSILLIVGCSNNANTNDSANSNSDEESSGAFTVVDDRGVEVTFDKIPETIVSLQPSNTEILFELGVGERIIGVTKYDFYPEQALEIEKVSDLSTVNIERIVEMHPDIVFAYTSGSDDQINQLENVGLKVFVIKSASSIEDIYGDIRQLANVMGVEDKGEKVISDIQSQIDAVREKTEAIPQKKKVYFEISPAPDIWSIGSGTFQQELISAAGVENIYGDQQGWFSVSEEDILTRNPEAIITTVNYGDDPIAEINSRNGWSSVTAIQNKAVYFLNPDILDRPGPRIGEAVEIIASSIYPELFNK